MRDLGKALDMKRVNKMTNTISENVKELLKTVRIYLELEHANAEARHDNPDDELYMSYAMYTIMEDTNKLMAEIDLIIRE